MAGPEVIHQYGLAVDRPAASASNEGVYYTASDTAGGTTYRSNGTTWDTIAAGASSGVTAHSALSGLTSGDDHTQYQKESEKSAASGYASLDGSTKVPAAELPALNGITAPTGDVSMNSHKLTTVTDPTSAQDAATKAYSDNNRLIKTVRVASTVTRALATEVENGDTIDGVTLATGDRVLLKDQSTAADCGIYVVAASGAPTRATDFDASAEIVGSLIVVQEGTANADTIWLCTTNAAITVGSTSLAFVKIYPSALSLALDGLSDVVAPTPASGDVLKWNGSNWVNDVVTSGGGGALGAYILIEDQKTSGTVGGTATSGAWRTRDLNTEVVDTNNLVTIGSNQITLLAGTYRIRATAPAYFVNRHSIRLQNITDATTILSGTSEYSERNTDATQSRSELVGRFTIAGTKVLELQHQVGVTSASTGFGVASGTTFTVDHEVYSRVELWTE